MKKKIVLCKPVKGGMTEQEKAEAGFLYNPNTTDEMKRHRFKIQDALCEYNKLKPSQVGKRRNFLAKIFGKIGKRCNILPPFRCDYGFHIEVGENFFANYNFVVLDGNYVRIGDNVWIAPNVGIYAAGRRSDHRRRHDRRQCGGGGRVGRHPRRARQHACCRKSRAPGAQNHRQGSAEVPMGAMRQAFLTGFRSWT